MKREDIVMLKYYDAQPLRPAWVEIDLAQLRSNFATINKDRPRDVTLLSVVKDQAYGHGAVEVAREALAAGAVGLAVATIDEALELRATGLDAPILLFGERTEAELRVCLDHNLTVFVNDAPTAQALNRLAREAGKQATVHVEVDTGLNRYGVRWTDAVPTILKIAEMKALVLEGVMSHFAMSDELDKSFALEQLARFNSVLKKIQSQGIEVRYRHMCNTGGFLDLPQAHLDLVRVGILPLGVYPSQVCRRIPGLEPIMTLKTRVAALKEVPAGDTVGYGMRYRAESPRRIAVLPIGYGDGFPRVRNVGAVLLGGRRAPVVGGNAMDATMVDVTDIPDVQPWDEVVVLGRQGGEQITVHELAKLKGTVSYEVLTAWSARLPRVYLKQD